MKMMRFPNLHLIFNLRKITRPKIIAPRSGGGRRGRRTEFERKADAHPFVPSFSLPNPLLHPSRDHSEAGLSMSDSSEKERSKHGTRNENGEEKRRRRRLLQNASSFPPTSTVLIPRIAAISYRHITLDILDDHGIFGSSEISSFEAEERKVEEALDSSSLISSLPLPSFHSGSTLGMSSFLSLDSFRRVAFRNNLPDRPSSRPR